LLTIYLTVATTTLFRHGHASRVRVARLTEIFPPPEDESVARELIGFAARKAKRLGSYWLEIYALDPTTAGACGSLGLDSFRDKTVYIAPGRLKGSLAEKLVVAENWWCRGVTEGQFEEAYETDPNCRTLAESQTLF
jgi:hypothetical protein